MEFTKDVESEPENVLTIGGFLKRLSVFLGDRYPHVLQPYSVELSPAVIAQKDLYCELVGLFYPGDLRGLNPRADFRESGFLTKSKDFLLSYGLGEGLPGIAEAVLRRDLLLLISEIEQLYFSHDESIAARSSFDEVEDPPYADDFYDGDEFYIAEGEALSMDSFPIARIQDVRRLAIRGPVKMGYVSMQCFEDMFREFEIFMSESPYGAFVNNMRSWHDYFFSRVILETFRCTKFNLLKQWQQDRNDHQCWIAPLDQVPSKPCIDYLRSKCWDFMREIGRSSPLYSATQMFLGFLAQFGR